jgi:hypothetical protein
MKPSLISILVMLAMGCTIGESDAPLSYEEFQAKYIGTFTDDEGNAGIYYDGDQVLDSMDQVAQLYAIYLDAKTKGMRMSAATAVATVQGKAIKWPAATAKNLTYCVSDKFGEYKTRVVTAVRNAGTAWEDATGGKVQFVYTPEHDAKCNTSAPVIFDVVPSKAIPDYFALAFYPNDPRADRSVLINIDLLFGGVTQVGTLRHELGHALGLAHETARDEAVEKFGEDCIEDIYLKPLTDYDEYSVMNNWGCLGTEKNKSRTLTQRDIAGIRKLYP